MKRFAANYLYLPGYGFLKQYAVEVNETGRIVCVFPLKSEAEAISWLSGIISVVPEDKERVDVKKELQYSFLLSKNKLQDVPESIRSKIVHACLQAIWIYPFDFEKMEPTTQSKYSILK